MGYCYCQTLPRCGAYARSAGRPCLQAAMANGRCYIHGGKAKVKHSRYTKQAEQQRKDERRAIRELREVQKAMEGVIDG